MGGYKVIRNARERKELANNPALQPELRDWVTQVNANVSWPATTTTTSTTTTTTTTT